MAEETVDMTALKEQVQQLDSNQEDLIQIMKSLREKIIELSESASGGGGEANEEIQGLKKKLRKTKLSSDKELSELRSTVEDLSQHVDTLKGLEDTDPAAELMPDIEAVWNEVEGVETRQKELMEALQTAQKQFDQWKDQPQIEEIHALMDELDTQTSEFYTAITGLEEMFNDVGQIKENTESILESTAVEQADLEHRMAELARQFRNLAIEEKVDRAALEQEIETLRDQAEDVSWIEERLEQLAMAEAVDSAGLQEQISEIKEDLSDRSEVHRIQRQLDIGVSQELQFLEHKMAALNDELGELANREQADKTDIKSIQENMTALNELLRNVEKIESAYKELGHLKDRVEEHAEEEQEELLDLEDEVEALQHRFKEDVKPIKKQQNRLEKQVEKVSKRFKDQSGLEQDVAALEQDMNELSELVLKVLDRRS